MQNIILFYILVVGCEEYHKILYIKGLYPKKYLKFIFKYFLNQIK